MPRDVRMHGEHHHRAFVVCLVELVDPHFGHFAWRAVAVAARIKQRRVVENPLDGEFHHSRRFAVLDQLVRPVVGHEGALVAKPQLANDAQRVGTEVPARRTIANGTFAGHTGEFADGAREQCALHGIAQRGIHLVNPAVHANLVTPALPDRGQHLRRQRQADGWNEERRRNPVLVQQVDDATDSNSAAVLPLRERARVGLTESQCHGLVVGVEREQHGHAGTIRPLVRL